MLALNNQDTLRMDLTYRMTDSTGVLICHTDTAMEILSANHTPSE